MNINARQVTFQKLIPAILFILFFTGLAWIQFASPNMPDNDGFYHIKLACIMRTDGLKPDFIWLPQSILNRNEFYDHHFLFHVALIPFTFGDLRVGAKLAAVTFASFAFLAVWYLFHRQRIPFAWLWALGLLGISEAFLYRMSVTRAQSLSLGILALGFLWLLERRYKHLAVLAFVYVWMYDAFPLLIALAVLYTIAVLLVDRQFDYRPLLFVTMGILIGMLINPYFPDNVTFSIRHILPKLMDDSAVKVGNEWYPYTTGQLIQNSLPALIAFASGIWALGLAGRKMDIRTAFALLASLLFGLMLLQARRFVEYFPPFALIFTAFAWSPLLPDPEPAPGNQTFSPSLTYPQKDIPLILLSLAVLAGLFRTLPVARSRMLELKPFYLYADASRWLAQNTQEGDMVFQTDWDDFPRLFYYNIQNTYLIGLDPTYMQIYNPELYDLWVPLVRGEVKQPSQFIDKIFHARYVITDLHHQSFILRASADPYMEVVYRDGESIIYQLNR